MAKGIDDNNAAKSLVGICKPCRRMHLIPKRRNAPNLKRFSEYFIQGVEESNFLESLPQDILVNILTKLTHGDLKHSLLVSKFISEAALVAWKTHFLYTTPSTKPAFNRRLELSGSEFSKAVKPLEQMKAKEQKAKRFQCNGRRLSSVFALL